MTTSFHNRAAAFGVAALASVTLLWAAQPKAGDSFPDLKQFELEGTLPDGWHSSKIADSDPKTIVLVRK